MLVLNLPVSISVNNPIQLEISAHGTGGLVGFKCLAASIKSRQAVNKIMSSIIFKRGATDGFFYNYYFRSIFMLYLF